MNKTTKNAIQYRPQNSVYNTEVLSRLGSSVGIPTGYGLDGRGIESRLGARFSAPVQTVPRSHPASCTMGTGSFPGVNSGRGVTLTPQPILVLWSRKIRAISLLPLWAVRPVQSPIACTRVHLYLYLYLYSPYGPYGLYRASVPVQGCTFTFTRNVKGFYVFLCSVDRASWFDPCK